MIYLGKITKNGKDIILEEKNNGCLECVSHSKDDYGYTRIYFKGKHSRLFRVIYEQKYGEIPKGMVVRHICDNPSCCNINHLELGTPTDNVNDMITRGRSGYHKTKPTIQGTKNKSNILSEEDVKNIYLSKFSYKKLSVKYNVSKTTIMLIKKQKMWKWLTDKL